MKTIFKVFLVFALLFMSSCKKDRHPQTARYDTSNMEEIVIDPVNGEFLPIDSFIQEISYIKLSSDKDNLIGEVSQVLFTDSLIIVVDYEVARNVSVFDLKGNFKYTVGRIGNGPGEFVEPSYVCLKPGEETIVIFDGPQHRVLYYNYEGEFQYMEPTPFMLGEFEYLPSGFKAYNVSSMKDPVLNELKENTLIVTDQDDDVVYGACYDFYEAGRFIVVMSHSLWKFEDQVFFSPNFSDTIYAVKDDGVEARYHIDIKHNKMPPITHETRSEDYDEYIKKYLRFNGHFIELKDYSFFNISTPYGNPFCVYSHKKKKTILNTGNGNHPFYAFLYRQPLARYGDDGVVIVIQPHEILARKEHLYNGGLFNRLLDDLFKDLTEDSNPVLFIYHINNEL